MEVSPDNDAILRHIVWHHSQATPDSAFVNLPLVAFDNPREARRYFTKASSNLKAKQSNGEVDTREYIFCDARFPDHKSRHIRLRIIQNLHKARLLHKSRQLFNKLP
jgi:hypothetical protein